MDNSGNNIDDIFKSRFSDAKDYSVNPETTWKAVELGLDSAAMSTGAVASTIGKFSALKTAAVFTGMVVSAGVLDSDRTLIEIESSTYAMAYNQWIEQTAEEDAHQANATNETAKFTLGEEIINETKPQLPSNSVNLASAQRAGQASTTLSPAIDSTETNDYFFEPLASITGSPVHNRRSFNLPKLSIQSIRSMYNSSIERPEIIEPTIAAWGSSHMWFIRAGMRIGSGESNSFEIDSEWKANPSFSFGYGFSLTDKSFVTAEIGWLRRSGNGIERTRDVDLNPVISGISETFGQSLYENDLLIHESLVATRMDYIHIPINYNYQFNDNWSVSVGGFADVLIAAKNDGYIVYNNTEYQASITGKSEVSSLDGLNRVRYGAIMGAERKIVGQLSGYGQLMVPLNSPVDNKSDYRVLDETNRLVDLNIGLTYRL